MSDHQLSLPDDVYQNLLTAAVMEGITPVDWIAAHVPHRPAVSTQQQSLYDVLADVAGSIGADEEPSQQDIKTVVGQAIAAKLAKQGLDVASGAQTERRGLDEALGAINSQEEPRPSYDRTAFGEAIAAKLANS